MGLKPTEILLILVVVLLLFGGSRLPQLGQSLGSAIRNFKKGFQGAEDPAETADAQKSAAQLSSASPTKDASGAATTNVAPKQS